jgi:Rieske Fe-S protein
MGSIPVANASPPKRLRFPRREIAIGLTLASGFTALVIALVFAWPTGPKVDQVDWVAAGRTSDFELLEPIRNTEHRFWLVRLGDEDFIALSAKSPHRGCTVPWRPEFEFMGKKGWFRDPCYGSTFAIDGTLEFGPSPRGMDQLPVLIVDGQVQVDTDPEDVILGPSVGPR